MPDWKPILLAPVLAVFGWMVAYGIAGLVSLLPLAWIWRPGRELNDADPGAQSG